jgi:hypothetical protein
MKMIFGCVMLIFGIMMMAGSAGDCDGKCMEYSNTIGEMLISIGIGLTMSIVGGIILINENSK